MQMFIKNILFVFTVFIHFDELKASGHKVGPSGHEASPPEHGNSRARHGAGLRGHEAGSSGHGPGLSGHGVSQSGHEAGQSGHGAGPSGHGIGPPGNGDGQTEHEAGNSVPGLPEELRPILIRTFNVKPTWSFYFGGQQVGVWFTRRKRIVGIGLLSGNIYPSMHLARNYNLQTYLAEKYDIFFLVHALPNGYIVGIQNMVYNDIGNDDGVEQEIRLEHRNIIPSRDDRMAYQIKIEFIDDVGLRFYAFRLLSGYIIGVTLGPLSNN
ncbi:uncharacterized protein LOC117171050 [Belonocnema kinseyi]|uniref:uncharacterized protein LOC117171050 n=1 Tax=Belonocnema kinseyi TaxID=2817044 RepID=UPI00143CE13C|nr:uncharacterized protein LOC117171050 [Belonocnema kinseyi]XP_033213992.1 uncharacterized protein LOC117171050 [Belonocnema kinseyi]